MGAKKRSPPPPPRQLVTPQTVAETTFTLLRPTENRRRRHLGWRFFVLLFCGEMFSPELFRNCSIDLRFLGNPRSVLRAKEVRREEEEGEERIM